MPTLPPVRPAIGPKRLGNALLPLAAADHLVGAYQTARRGEQDADRQFGHVGRIGVCAVRDHDPAPAGGVEVDPLVARAVAAEQGEPRQGGHHGIGDADTPGADDCLHRGGRTGRDVGRGGRGTVHMPDDPAALSERSERRLGEMEAGQDVRLVGHGRAVACGVGVRKREASTRRKTGLAKNGTLCKVRRTKRPAAFKRI